MNKINVIDYFEETIKKFPNKTALVEGDKRIDFKTLNSDAKNLAQQIIININKIINKPIAVYLPKSIQSVVADIAITYSGNTYMNLDVNLPSIRIRNTLELIRPATIITNKNLAGFIEEINANLQLIIIDEIDYVKQADCDLIKNRLEKIIDREPLCIINTSGSTRTPKGVVLNHIS